MLKQFAPLFIRMGEDMARAEAILSSGGPPSDDQMMQVAVAIDSMSEGAGKLKLKTSAALLRKVVGDPPRTLRELQTLRDAVYSEIKSVLLVYIPEHRAEFFERRNLLSEGAKKSFPTASAELREAGNCFAAGRNTATVFHAMRAAEIGAKTLAVDLKCQFPHPLDLVDMHSLLEQCDSKINAMKNLPKSQQKADDLEFYSMASSNFRYFKDGWRVRTAHPRAVFEEGEALSIFTRTVEFFEIVAQRLREPSSPSSLGQSS